MRVAVTGATGNVGTALLRALEREPAVDGVVGIARRVPGLELAKVDWASADVARDPLEPLLRGADAVVHLAWRIQPSRRLTDLWHTNVTGSRRVLEAAARAGVRAVVVASSVGAYSPGPKDRRVDESWPTLGTPTSFYARHKAELERSLERFVREREDVRTTWLRPALVFQRDSASEQRRLFLGPLVPTPLFRTSLVPVVPDVPGLRVQAVHADDVADAYRRAVLGDVRGPFNVAAEPPLDAAAAAAALGRRTVRVPVHAVRTAIGVLWRLRLQPTPPGWLDMGLSVPLLDCARARGELGWEPKHGALETAAEVTVGMREGAGTNTPALRADAGGPFRVRELLTLAGTRESV